MLLVGVLRVLFNDRPVEAHTVIELTMHAKNKAAGCIHTRIHTRNICIDFRLRSMPHATLLQQRLAVDLLCTDPVRFRTCVVDPWHNIWL